MLEKLNNKIQTEIDKVIKRQDLSIEELKNLIEIKNGLEMKEILKESINNSSLNSIEFQKELMNIQKGEIQYDTNNNK